MQNQRLALKLVFVVVCTLVKRFCFLLLLSGPGVSFLIAESPVLFPVMVSGDESGTWNVSVFSGEVSVIPFRFIAKDGITHQMTYDLIQITSGLAAPVEKAVRIGSFSSDEGDTLQRMSLKVSLPEVERISQFLCRITSQSGNEESILLAQVFFTVYPPKQETEKEISSLIETVIEDQGGEVILFGDENPYLDLLDTMGVDVEDLTGKIPTSWADHDLMIGAGTQQQLQRILEVRQGRLPDQGILIWVEPIQGVRSFGKKHRVPNGLVFRHIVIPEVTLGDSIPELHFILNQTLRESLTR